MKLRFSIEATAHIAKRPSQAHEADSPKVPRLRIAQSGDGCGGLFLHRLERWALFGLFSGATAALTRCRVPFPRMV